MIPFEEKRIDQLEQQNQKLKAQLEVAMEALKYMSIGDVPEHLQEVAQGWYMNTAREAIQNVKKIEEISNG